MKTKYELRITGEFKQNLKRCKRRGLPMGELWTVVGKLLNGETLEEKYHAHLLTGDRRGQWFPPQCKKTRKCGRKKKFLPTFAG